MTTGASFITGHLHAKMTAWRHDFHRHPEVGMETSRTAAIVEKILRDNGVSVRRVANFGVVGVLRRGKGGASIGLRADMDALPIAEAARISHQSREVGKMHACGHDGHTAMLLGAACYLARRGRFCGAVHFIFQPDEEGGGGAQAMIDDGLFARTAIARVFGMHNLPSLAKGRFALREGGVMAGEDRFAITIAGRGGHAAQPHLCADAMVAAAEIILSLQTVVARVVNPSQGGVVSVTQIQSDGATNVLPGQVILRGDARAFDSKTRRDIRAAIARIAKNICAAHRATLAEFSYESRFEPTINAAAETAIAAAVARQTAGAKNVDDDCGRMMFSEDFGRMLAVKPGAFIFIGNGEKSPPLHNPCFDFDDDILPLGADYWVRLVESELAAGADSSSS